MDEQDSEESSEQWDSDDSEFVPPGQRTNANRRDQVEIKLNKIPNMLILFFNYSHQFKINIFFPEIYLDQRKNKTLRQLAFLPRTQRAEFIDQVFLPSAIRVLPNSLFNKLYSSYFFDESNGIESGTSQFVMAGHFSMIVDKMRARISRHKSLKQYENFFFVTTAFGGKQVVEFTGDGCIDHEAIGLGDLDWEKLQDQLDIIKIDFGIDLDVEDNNGCTFFLESDSTTQKHFSGLYSSFCTNVFGEEKFWPAFLSSFGGFTFRPTTSSKSPAAKVIAYSDYKNPFYTRGGQDRHGADFEYKALQCNNTRRIEGVKVSSSRKHQVHFWFLYLTIHHHHHFIEAYG